MSGETSDSRPAPEDDGQAQQEDGKDSTLVTKVTKQEDRREHPMMSFTAVTSHQTMAEAFIRELIAIGQRMMPDHHLSVADLATICQVALDAGDEKVTMLEGRHLRTRVGEQISRANRYGEPFSLLALKFGNRPNRDVYDSIVDTLCERMRKSDLMFLFKSRIVLILPHTHTKACEMLKNRIRALLLAVYTSPPDIEMTDTTYPNPDFEGSAAVLDWCEDQLRD